MKNNADGIEVQTFSLIAVHFALFEGKYQHAHVRNHDASEGYKVIFPYHQRCSLLNTSAENKRDHLLLSVEDVASMLSKKNLKFRLI